MLGPSQYGQPSVLDPNGPFAPQSYDRVTPISYVVGTADVTDSGAPPDLTGTVVETLDPFTSSASGTSTPPPITGTVAVTLGSFVGKADENVSPFATALSSRRIIDQFGNVYLMHNLQSWSMAMNLNSHADMTQALQDAKTNHFNAVTVWGGGGFNPSGFSGWNRYTNKMGNAWWTSTPWTKPAGTALGAAWAEMDWVVSECKRLGLTLNFSFCGGAGTAGARADWIASNNTHMQNIGVEIANRYPVSSNPHIVWHVMWDDTSDSTAQSRINALFAGINSVEGSTTRLRWEEPWIAVGSSWAQDGSGGTMGNLVTATWMNGWYSWNDTATTDAEGSYGESGATTRATGAVEPRYHQNPPNTDHQLRATTWSTFIEGAAYCSYGDMDWYPFEAESEVTGLGLGAWVNVVGYTQTIQQSYVLPVLNKYLTDPGWLPTSSFVTTGEGTAGSKAAIGAASHAALAYFPDARTIVVDTTIIAGTSNVRLRWFDPVANSYSTIAASEAQQTGRSVTLPAARGDGTRDFVLIVDDWIEGPASSTLGSFTSSASGTVVAYVGTVARTLGSFTSSASGTVAPPPITGTAAVTLGSFTSTASGQQGETGSSARTLGSFTSTATGQVGQVGSSAVTLGVFTPSASGTYTPPPVTGTAAVTLAAFVSNASGTVVAFVGTVARTLGNFTSSASGTYVPPPVTGTATPTLSSFTTTTTGQVGQTGSAAPVLSPFTSTTSGTYTPPPISGTAAPVLGSFTSTTTGQVGQNGTESSTLGSFTSAATGSFAPAGSGFGSPTLGSFTSTVSGTYTPPPVTGTAAPTLGSFVAAASGTRTLPGISGTVAAVLAAFLDSATGTIGENGTGAALLTSFTSNASGTSTPPSGSGSAAVVLNNCVATATGTATPPSFTGTTAVTLALVVIAASGTVTAPSNSGSLAKALGSFVASAAGVVTLPAITGTVAITLGPFLANQTEATGKWLLTTEYPTDLRVGREIVDAVYFNGYKVWPMS